MRLINYFLAGVLLAFLLVAGYAWSAETIRECPQADGTTVYTNKDLKGCYAMLLPELSTSAIPATKSTTKQVTQTPLPDYATVDVAPESVNARLCGLYAEWMTLQEKTFGGFANNTIPDTQRRLVLVQLFGSGFTPSSCK